MNETTCDTQLHVSFHQCVYFKNQMQGLGGGGGRSDPKLSYQSNISSYRGKDVSILFLLKRNIWGKTHMTVTITQVSKNVFPALCIK